MKKLINLAVAVIMMTLCTVILGACSGSEIEGDQPVRPVDPTVDEVLRNNCTENVVNTYTSDNAEIKTRSVVVPQGNYEALISAKSVHQFIVDILYKEDVPVKQDSVAYTVTNTVKGYGLKKTRFARSVKHGLIEPCVPIGKLDSTGQHIHRPFCSITAHQFFDKGVQFTGIEGSHGLILNEVAAGHIDVVAVTPESRFILSGGFLQRGVVDRNGCVHYSSPHSSP